MPFERGNQLYKNRKAELGGRPTREEAEAERKAAEKELNAADRARAKLEQSVDKIMDCYVVLASSGADPSTTRHAVDKFIPAPDGKEKTNSGDTFIQFVFGNSPAPRRDIDVGLPEEEQRGNLNGGAIRFLGSNGRG